MKIYSLFIITLFFSTICFAQNVGVGTATPDAKADINGTLKISDGTQGSGKVLTSDMEGLASWQVLSTSSVEPVATRICCTSWMANNLNVSTYRNGDPIPKVTNNAQWQTLTTGAYCYFNNDSTTYAAKYGKLYNWYAVNDPRGLAPEGWHIPTMFEWNQLAACLGGNDVAGSLLKSTGTYWDPPNTDATNITNFSARGGGYREISGGFYFLGTVGNWWTATEQALFVANYLVMVANEPGANIDVFPKADGLSVKCVRD